MVSVIPSQRSHQSIWQIFFVADSNGTVTTFEVALSECGEGLADAGVLYKVSHVAVESRHAPGQSANISQKSTKVTINHL